MTGAGKEYVKLAAVSCICGRLTLPHPEGYARNTTTTIMIVGTVCRGGRFLVHRIYEGGGSHVGEQRENFAI